MVTNCTAIFQKRFSEEISGNNNYHQTPDIQFPVTHCVKILK